jgi:8-oxo-dGTP pyrophosphatase MutT (NUDIX family)
MIVVAGLALRDGKMLMQLRRPDVLRPNLWEHPGGKVEPGELPTNALVREWKEELAHHYCGELNPLHIAGFVGNRIKTVEFDVERRIVISLYHVDLPTTIDVVARDAVDIGWFDPLYAIEHLPCSPGSYLCYPAIRDFVARKAQP